MQFEFRVLGPLEVRRDGSALTLSGAKLRLLLADLLVQPGHVVTIDRLAEDLWPRGAPGDPPHAIQQHVSLLRKTLGDTDRALVRERAPGYLLDVDPGSVDAVRFERLLADARDAAASDPARAATRAAEALALWRGDAFADVAYEGFAQAEIARLTELRLETEEERIDAELALGKSSELVGELEALVTAAPVRERRWGQLMRALARAGRQADALKAYQLARKHFLDQLGLEPGEQLRELERRILQGDPSLVAAPRAESAPRVYRRLVTVVAVEPDVSLDLDPEVHERELARAAEIVAAVAVELDAQSPERFVLVFPHEDQWERASTAAAAVQERLGACVGIVTGEALLGDGSIRGPLVERARAHAREGGVVELPASRTDELPDTPFVGRGSELERLRGARVALLVGPPGIGKSRLARELAREGTAAFGRSSSYGARSLAPLHEIAAALGAPDALTETPAAEVPLVFRRLCEAAGALLVVFDDVQWAGDLVVETIEHLATHGAGEVRVLCLARDELLDDRPAFLPSAVRVALDALPPEDAETLASQLAGADETVVRRALTAAEGNPLFIEQVVAHAAEGGESLPATLKALLAARLDRLTPSERRAIEHAAVIGREFDASLLADLVGTHETAESLVRRGLLEQAPSTTPFEQRFRFRHALIQEAAYAASSHAERSGLHERVAGLLEDEAADETVGFHLEQAAALRPERDAYALDLAQRAGRTLAAAGIAAWKRGDAAAAVGLLERAVALLDRHDSERGDLLCELGIALNSLGETARARAVLAEAADTGDELLALRGAIELETIAIINDSGGTAGRLLDLTESALPVFVAVHDERSLGRTWMLRGWVLGGAQARHADWREAAERALAHYGKGGWPVSTCIGHIATALSLGPTPVPAAVERCRTLLETAAADLVAEATVSAPLGLLHAMKEDFDASATLLARARDIYTELGRTPSVHIVCGPAEARAAVLEGDLERAAAVYTSTCEALQALHGGFHLATQAAELAAVLHELDRLADAERWCDVAAAHAQPGDVAGSASVGIARARLLAARERIEDAEAAARDALALAAQTDEVSLRAAAHLACSHVLATAGRPEDAARELAAATQVYLDKQNTAAASGLSRGTAAAAS